VFLYYGEGQSGNMQWKSGNVAIRDHAATGKDLLLFQTLGKSRPLRFLGQFACAGWHYASAPDSNGKQRQAIVFQLAQVDSPDAIESAGFLPTPTNLSLTELRARALNAVKAPSSGTETHRKKVYRERSEAIRAYVLCRAEGTCEDCGTAAPFKTPKDVPYLEPHHIRRLSDGGPDDPRFMAALRPNCHRHIHHGAQGATRNEALLKAIRLKEATLDRKSQ